MSIRTNEISARRPVPALAEDRRRLVPEPTKPVGQTQGIAKAIHRSRANAARQSVSIYSALSVDGFSREPSSRGRIMARLAHIETVLAKHAKEAGPGDKGATLDIGRVLVAEIGRRVRLLDGPHQAEEAGA